MTQLRNALGVYPENVLSFTCKQGGDNLLLYSLLSKGVSLLHSSLICRSDGIEDFLADSSGAGLYDITATKGFSGSFRNTIVHR